jgi:hypothetical protein
MLQLACHVCRTRLRPEPGRPGAFVCPVAEAEVTRDAAGRLRRTPDALHATSGHLWLFGRLTARRAGRAP